MRRGNILAHIATLSGGVALMLHANDPVVVGSHTIPPLALVIVGSAMALMAGAVLADRLARGGYTLYLFLRSQSPIKVFGHTCTFGRWGPRMYHPHYEWGPRLKCIPLGSRRLNIGANLYIF